MSHREVVGNVRRLRESQRFLEMGREQLHSIQDERFRAVLRSAMNTKAYSDLYGGTVFAGLDDLQAIPPITRRHLVGYPLEQRIGVRRSSVETHTTAGTTGRPLTTAWTKDEIESHELVVTRQLIVQRMPVSHKLFVVDLSRNKARAGFRIGDRTVDLSVANATDRIAWAIREQASRLLWGLPSLILELTPFLDGYELEGLITSGEMLDPHTRAELHRQFGIRPMDAYASTEAGYVLWECPSGLGYHVNSDEVIVEVLDERGAPVPDGDGGELVMTSLWNRTCPLIRYRTGDFGVAIAGDCGCGIKLPLFGPPEGRSNDRVATPDGRHVSPMRLLLIVLMGENPIGLVRRYRILQRAHDDFLIEMQWANGRREDLVERIAPFYSSVLDTPVSVEVKDVDDLTTTGRKFRVFESLVSGQLTDSAGA